MEDETIAVTPMQVRGARLRMKVDALRGEESSPAIKAMANARPVQPAAELEEPVEPDEST